MILAFVHGFMGAPSDWDNVRTELQNFKTITPPIRPAPDWDTGVAQLEQEIPENSVLIGYSMGARLSLALALAHPQRYRGLIFCSGNPGIEEEQQRVNRYASDCRLADRIAKADRQEFLEYWYSSAVFASLRTDVRKAEIERKLARGGDDWSGILRTYSVAQQPNFWPCLPELQLPCLAIAGQQDKKYARLMARMNTLSNIQTRIVPACGHIVHHEQPHVFLYLVREFLTTIE